jgi:hypothetical protein
MALHRNVRADGDERRMGVTRAAAKIRTLLRLGVNDNRYQKKAA